MIPAQYLSGSPGLGTVEIGSLLRYNLQDQIAQPKKMIAGGRLVTGDW